MKRADTPGAWGESQAARYLKKKGYRIVEKNFSCRFGEVDIIAQKGECLIFVEVKLRKDDSHGQAREFVTAQKQQRILRTAETYLAMTLEELQPRFDVVEVYAPRGVLTARPRIIHLENAF